MGLGRTLLLPSTTGSPFFPIPKTTQIPSLSLISFSFSSYYSSSKRRSLKCSFDYRDNHYNQAVVHARPAEIQWKKELCNLVHLIGIVGAPVEIKHLPSGKVVAWTRLAVKKSATDTSWINLTFWDELAEVASQHIEKGHQIYVSGRLISDSVENDDGKLQTYYKVVVEQLNFIERSSPKAALYDYDFNIMATGRKLGNSNANDMGSTEELWQAFFANPSEWWDNRKNKRNPKYPDFKHKDTGEALWVGGRNNPSWVNPQLAILDEKMGSLHDQDPRLQVSSMSVDDSLPLS